MKNYLISEAIGDIAGSVYEGKTKRIKDYDKVKLFGADAHFTDDTVLTFACAEAFIDGLDMTMNLWKCANEHRHAGFSKRFKEWMASHKPQPYRSLGNGSAMRCSSAGWLAKTEEECVRMATETAMPTHNHPESIKGAVATALAIFHLKCGKDKDFVREHVLNEYYPEWANKKYDEFHDEYSFYSTCAGTVGPAMICFLESDDYVDCIKLAISLGGDADTLAAIAGPIAYAYYRSMPDTLVYQALKKLPEWMVDVSERFDEVVNSNLSAF
ncbi:MAG: ADP-ribosylglycohydrolase family protein [Prevotellaceae bacterium]|nr:ADP-ribosylglycohydrolase family protein [Prevotellaceae bacterium]